MRMDEVYDDTDLQLEAAFLHIFLHHKLPGEIVLVCFRVDRISRTPLVYAYGQGGLFRVENLWVVVN